MKYRALKTFSARCEI